MDYRPIRGEFVALLQMQWDRETEQLLLLVQEPPKDHRTGKEWTLTVGVLRATAGREEFYRPRTSVKEARALRTPDGVPVARTSVVEVHSTHVPNENGRWCNACDRMIANSNGPTASGVDPCVHRPIDYQTC